MRGSWWRTLLRLNVCRVFILFISLSAEWICYSGRLQQALEDDQPPPPYQHPQQQQQQRQSPSPTHLSLAAHSHIRPSIYSHQRRDSDTLRNVPTSMSTQSNLGTSSSPTVVEHGYGHGHGGYGNQRLSPPTRGQPLNLQGRQNSHKRSPTAPEVSMGNTGAEGEREKEREVRSRQLQQQQQQQQAPPPRPASVPAPPPGNQAAAAAPAPIPGRQLTVSLLHISTHPSSKIVY